MYDAIIVGGRCAGAPLALRLARAGHRVLVVERATFPSDTMSTHFIQSCGIVRLKQWGLLDEVFATTCPPLVRARFDTGADPLEFEFPPHPGIPGAAAPRRYILDKLLIDAAVTAGAELAEGVAIDGVIHEDGRVVGVRGHDRSGDFEARGRFVIGADGRHSGIAKAVGADFRSYEAPLGSGYYSYFSDVEMNNTVRMFLLEDQFAVVYPTNNDLTLVALAWRNDRFSQLKRDIDGNFRAGLGNLGELGERILAGTREERYVGSADIPNFLREGSGPGWALVGDALFHKDPTPADGISDAFRAADLLADTLDEILTGTTDEATAMTRYRERHDSYAIPQLDQAIRSANFDLPPQERLGAFFEIRMDNEEEVNELLEQSTPA